MKGVLFLGLVGFALYLAIDVSHNLLSSDGAAKNVSPQALSSPAARPMRSWGTDLPALSIEASPPRSEAKGSVTHQPSAPVVSAALSPAPSETPAYDPTEWLSVRLAGRVHREPSVSSPTTQFYQPGTTLQAVSRQNGWVEISDPTSKHGGWMLEQYLAQTDGPHATQNAGQRALADQIRRRRSRLRLGARAGPAHDRHAVHPSQCDSCRRELSLDPARKREEAWGRLAMDLDLAKLDSMTSRARLDDVPALAGEILAEKREDG